MNTSIMSFSAAEDDALWLRERRERQQDLYAWQAAEAYRACMNGFPLTARELQLERLGWLGPDQGLDPNSDQGFAQNPEPEVEMFDAGIEREEEP